MKKESLDESYPDDWIIGTGYNNVDKEEIEKLRSDKLFLIGLILMIVIIGVSFILGYTLGQYIQEQILLDELKIRDFNLTNRMCLTYPNYPYSNESKIAYCKNFTNCKDFNQVQNMTPNYQYKEYRGNFNDTILHER